jgi:hypothetical protein
MSLTALSGSCLVLRGGCAASGRLDLNGSDEGLAGQSTYEALERRVPPPH